LKRYIDHRTYNLNQSNQSSFVLSETGKAIIVIKKVNNSN